MMTKLYFSKDLELWLYNPQPDITTNEIAQLLPFFTQSAVMAVTPYHHGFVWHEFLNEFPELWRHFKKEEQV